LSRFYFYDIESLNNVFTLCNFREADNVVDVFVLSDDPLLMRTPDFMQSLTDRIHLRNPNFNGGVTFHDLALGIENANLAALIGLSDAPMVNDSTQQDSYNNRFRPVCDTDTSIYNDDKYPYLLGYNSYNYDTTMLAYYLNDVFPPDRHGNFVPMTAKDVRWFNNVLFSPDFKKQMPTALACDLRQQNLSNADMDFKSGPWVIRKNMLLSGRHIDVARLNEKQRHVGLKRLLGMLGYQILESDKLGMGVDHINSTDELLELIAYNVSDCVNLAELFHHPFYQGQFSLKKGLLHTYPELVYQKRKDAYKPDIGPTHVRRDRLTIDSTSAQFATKSLCPYGHLPDIKTVSYMYPSERKVNELRASGHPDAHQVNVLEESKKFFYRHFDDPKLRAEFDKVYDFYKDIEGRNFNTSSNYVEDYGFNGMLPEELEPANLSAMNKKFPMFYYDADGKPTTCFVTFSTGGIHGAEYNRALYDDDMAKWMQDMADMAEVRRKFADPLDLRNAKTVTMDDGRTLPYKKFIVSSATIKTMTATDPKLRPDMFYKHFENDRPQLFKEKAGGLALNERYTFTSADLTNHEDFTSYYPNMLRMMTAFWNDGLGMDRYGEIFDNKQKYGKLRKDKSLTQAERDNYNVLREGTKLILNSASGAGDTKPSKDGGNYASPIQMNNRIISMRIIGQLFTWRIGQAQALHGAKITSTNTDGLYSVLEEELNNKILAKESADIGVEIEPEPTYLISKDSNNRLEMDPKTGEIQSASGGSLACRKDTDPTKSLAHPAIIDWALAEYLVVAALGYKNLSLAKPFDRDIGRSILESAKDKFDMSHLLRMYQNVLAASPGTDTYTFATRDGDEHPIILQHYNRVFIMKDDAPDTVHIRNAGARAITPTTLRKRKRNHERLQQNDPVAKYVLAANGVPANEIPQGKEAAVSKVTNIEAEWHMRIENRNLSLIPKNEQDGLYDGLDLDKYLTLLQNAYERNWHNHVPEDDSADKQAETVDDTTDSVVESKKEPSPDDSKKQPTVLEFANADGDVVARFEFRPEMAKQADVMRKQMKALGYTEISNDKGEQTNE